MNALRRLLLALVLGGLTASCGGGDPLKKLEEFADRMCKCEDQACVKSVNSDMVDWMKTNADRAPEPSDADKEKAKALMERMLKCANQASMAEGKAATADEGSASDAPAQDAPKTDTEADAPAQDAPATDAPKAEGGTTP